MPLRNRNVGGDVTSRSALRPQASAAAASFSLVGLGIDRESFQSALLKIAAGAATGSPSAVSVSAKLQESDDNSTFTDVATSTANPAVTAAIAAVNTNAFLEIDLSALKRYVRLVFTVAFTGGTSPTLLLAAEAVLGGSPVRPVAHA